MIKKEREIIKRDLITSAENILKQLYLRNV